MRFSQISSLVISVLIVMSMTILLYSQRINEAAGVALITLCLTNIYSLIEQLLISRKSKEGEE